MFTGQNIWVIKPNDCNRGRGVMLSNKLDEIKKIMAEINTKNDNLPKNNEKSQNDQLDGGKSIVLKSDSMII